MIAIAIVVFLFIFGLAGMHLFRWPLFNAAVRVQRAKSGLSLKQVCIDGHEIAYLDGGKGETLVLIHGFGANKDNWARVSPMLSRHFRLIIIDLPGFGDSTRDEGARYDVESQLTRLRLFIQALGLNSVHLGGNSMGGYLSALYSARHPDGVRSQWLLAPAGVTTANPSKFFNYLERGENPLLVRDPSDFRRLIGLCFNKIPYVPNAFQRCLCERNIGEREFNEKIFNEMFDDPLSLELELKGCVTKTQILWGDKDQILDVSGAGILSEIIKGSQSIVMKHMGHCPMLERPDETANLYLKFQSLK
ncbi:MAG TPA: alpha/beta hydrolase [Gammaproteobacteria bacterium]|nr:alpha/beta hydrolase [Gammaproteobacteria bacterium]|tara:strand:+ start:703 stop:1617 length:915 start_codon:yes stop_codon:yes gene_type:complete